MFYTFTGVNEPGRILRQGLDELRSGKQKLARIKGILNQATDAQLATLFGFEDTTKAAAAKAELLSDIAAITASEQQMFDQFG